MSQYSKLNFPNMAFRQIIVIHSSYLLGAKDVQNVAPDIWVATCGQHLLALAEIGWGEEGGARGREGR